VLLADHVSISNLSFQRSHNDMSLNTLMSITFIACPWNFCLRRAECVIIIIIIIIIIITTTGVRRRAPDASFTRQ